MDLYDPFGAPAANAVPEPRRRFAETSARSVDASADDGELPWKGEPAPKRARGAEDRPAFDEAGDEPPDEQQQKSARQEPPKMILRNSKKSVAELIGKVRPVRNPYSLRICSHFLKNDCMWGSECRFSHDPEALRAGAPATEEMNFSNLDAAFESKSVAIPRAQTRCMMTERARDLLKATTGLSEVTWDAAAGRALLSGTTAQLESAEQLLKRATTHCNWGISEAKVLRLLSPQPCSTARLTLSPMSPQLKQTTFSLSASKTQLSIGAGAGNDLTLRGPLLSRTHVLLEFVPSKGALYVVDMSTNGTFLNGVKLPAKSTGKVLLFHGDELLFPEPNKAVEAIEFGFMVNLEFS